MASQEEAQAQPVTEERGRSTVDFPYSDLDSAVEIAQTVRQLGFISCDPASLAAKLNMAPDGGGFRMRLITSKTFGLITYGRAASGSVELTSIGQLVSDQATERRGRLEAFMAIPLYKALFDRLKGQVMPPPPAIERLMENMGVAPKQKDKARQVFQRSAKQAGLFELSNDRLTIPPSLNTPSSAIEPATPVAERLVNGDDGGSDTRSRLPPFIQGLIDKLPPPDAEWDLVARAKWLTTAANIFDLMYTGGNDLGLKVKLEGSTLSVTAGDLS